VANEHIKLEMADKISQRDQTVAASASCLSLAVVAVALRFASRRMAKAPLWLDDWMAVVGLVFAAAFVANLVASMFIFVSFVFHLWCVIYYDGVVLGYVLYSGHLIQKRQC